MLQMLGVEAEKSGTRASITETYAGRSKWLAMWGVGAPGRSQIRDVHVSRGGFVILLDIGYFGRSKNDGYLRFSLNDDYCTRWLDRTPEVPGKWEQFETPLREDADPDGPIILAGIGPKQREYMGGVLWEQSKLAELRRRFPGRKIVYRPKPNRPFMRLDADETDSTSPIERVLRGASRVICMHSNVAVDACIAGVPFESEDGVSTWLRGKPFTVANRLSLLRRLACWQYKAHEAGQGLAFIRGIAGA